MNRKKISALLTAMFLIVIFIGCQSGDKTMSKPNLKTEQVIKQLKQKFGDEHAERIEKGVNQAGSLWTRSDGDQADFAKFCEDYFITEKTLLETTFQRFEKNLEQISGLNLELLRTLQEPMHLDIGPMLPVDMLFANFNPFVHVNEDLFKTRVAFTALLNFPLYSLEERLKYGAEWSREKWAQARLTQRFNSRVPSPVRQKVSEAMVAADNYINNYNIYMHSLVSPDGERPFPEGLKLISHWGLRDELKALYAEKNGLERQKMIHRVMEHIVHQTIPQVVIDNPDVTWDVEKNLVKTDAEDKFASVDPELSTRYQHLLAVFQAQKDADVYFPHLPSYIDRKFQEQREIPEEQFEQLLISVLSSPLAKDVSSLIEKRLGRKLEPFDIWYNGFKPRGVYDEAYLDQVVGERYPTVESFQNDLPFILRNLGFSPDKAAFLSSKIVVDPSRGAGHAWGAERREDNAHLRTRIPQDGMKYKGFNIAIHELGHCVEQVFSLNGIDYVLLQGVPNTGFTEAFAFVFQSRDLQLLGLKRDDPAAEHLKALDTFWSTFEISGVGLVDMRIWRWMYANPKAKPEDLKKAMLKIAKDVWNEYFAPVIGIEDQTLLAIYSHIIDAGLYTPDYPLGHIISFQVEQYLKDKNLAEEMERMCKLGAITPEAWMQAAVGAPISTEPMIKAAKDAVKNF
ncbi:MAG TPA: hypothetical protein ENN22_15610 [bacterium]|mgnify:CR=1 FL=1|nr:hypothetical protein [bacterium]